MSGRPYTHLQLVPKKSTYPLNKQLQNVNRHTKNLGKVALIWGIALAFTLPIFRSGLRTNLTLFEFIILHTIFGPDPEYIPKEIYSKIEVWG